MGLEACGNWWEIGSAGRMAPQAPGGVAWRCGGL